MSGFNFNSRFGDGGFDLVVVGSSGGIVEIKLGKSPYPLQTRKVIVVPNRVSEFRAVARWRVFGPWWKFTNLTFYTD